MSKYVSLENLTRYNNKLDEKINTNFSNIVADNYDSTSTYNVDDYVIYEKCLYKCTTEISTAEAWNDNHWDLVKITEELGGNVPTDLKVYYIDGNSSSNPFIFSEHPTGVYFFNGVSGVSSTSYYVYLKGDTEASSYYNARIRYDAYLVYFKDYSLASSSQSIAYISQSTYFIGDTPGCDKYTISKSTSSKSKLSISQTSDIASVVNIRTSQTVSGKKTFTTLPETSVVPTTDNQLTNKKYVDDSISSAVGNINTVLATLTTPSNS